MCESVRISLSSPSPSLPSSLCSFLVFTSQAHVVSKQEARGHSIEQLLRPQFLSMSCVSGQVHMMKGPPTNTTEHKWLYMSKAALPPTQLSPMSFRILLVKHFLIRYYGPLWRYVLYNMQAITISLSRNSSWKTIKVWTWPGKWLRVHSDLNAISMCHYTDTATCVLFLSIFMALLLLPIITSHGYVITAYDTS